MPADEQLLAGISLFSLLDADERRGLAEELEEESFISGATIFERGDLGDRLYVIRSGKVEVFIKESTGDKIILKIAEPGDLFGELAIFDHGARSASAVAIEDTKVLVLNHDALRIFLRGKPDAALDLLSVLAARLRETNEILRGRAVINSNEEIREELTWQQRIAHFIAEFSGSMSFLYINIVFFAVWIVLNLGWVPSIIPFDPFPFGLLTMAVSLEAIFLSIFVLLAQNLQSAKDRIRGDIEYKINLRAELEIAELHKKVDHMNDRILKRLQKY
ncbi:MAG: DUF1003 domain-containing protein [bacterium]|nr:DUF1003 domain-containing protein [bacterium]